MLQDETHSQDKLDKKCSYATSRQVCKPVCRQVCKQVCRQVLGVYALGAYMLDFLRAMVAALVPAMVKALVKALAFFVLCSLAHSSPASAQASAKTSIFLVQIKNLSSYRDNSSWTFGEGVWVLHDQEHPLFKHGEPLYPNGMHALLKHSRGGEVISKMAMHQGIVAGAIFSKKKIEVGEKISFAITASPGQRFSFVINLHESNDKFLAPMGKGIGLFDFFSQPISGSLTGYIHLWDGGTSFDEKPTRESVAKTEIPDPNDKVRLAATFDQKMAMTSEQKSEHETQGEFSYPPVKDLMKISIKPIPIPSQ